MDVHVQARRGDGLTVKQARELAGAIIEATNELDELAYGFTSCWR